MKKASQNQIEDLEKLKDKIKLTTDADEKTNLLVEAEQMLKDIDFMSSYYSNFVGDMRRYQNQKVHSIESTLVTILDDAIQYYKEI